MKRSKKVSEKFSASKKKAKRSRRKRSDPKLPTSC